MMEEKIVIARIVEEKEEERDEKEDFNIPILFYINCH